MLNNLIRVAMMSLFLTVSNNGNADTKVTNMDNKMPATEQKKDDFFSAVENKDLEKVKLLISAGLSPDVKNDDNKTVLEAMLSSAGYAEKRQDIVNYLIKQGADIHVVGGFDSTLLHEAVAHNMFSTVELLLDKGIDYKRQGEFSAQAFFYANNVEMIEFLVKKSAGSMQDVDKEGNTFLHKAVGLKPNFELVKYLLKHIDINVRNKEGKTVLSEAVSSDYFPAEVEKVVDYLLANGADINLVANNGRSAFLEAVRNRKLSLDVVEKLLKAGADIHQKDKDGIQAIHYSSASNYNYLKFLLQKGADINAVSDVSKETPLLIAARFNREATVSLLLENGANTDAQDREGKTALNYAREGDFSDVALLLDEKNAKANNEKNIQTISAEKEKQLAAEKEHKTTEINSLQSAIRLKNLPEVKKYYNELLEEKKSENLNMYKVIEFVIANGNLDIFKYFVDNGLDIHMLDEGYSLLHDAVFNNNLEITKYLIDSGLDVNYLSPDERSVFVMTANSSPEMVKLLIDNGVKIDKQREAGIANEAVGYFNPVMAVYFIDQGYEFDKDILQNEEYLLNLIQQQDTDSMKFALDNGLDIETRIPIYGDKASLLHLSVMIEADIMVDFLLQAGANPNARNSEDKPIFPHAINNGHMPILRALYNNGADVNDVYNYKDESPLQVALDVQRVDIARLFIEKGADVNQAFGSDKNTAMHIAAKKGYLDLLKRMIKNGGNVYILNRARKAPLDMAVEYDQKAVSAYLTEMEAKQK